MNLHFKAVGDGQPLIILHGLLGSSDNWRTMSVRLSAYWRVFAVDLRNHGESPHSEVFDYDAMVADLRRFSEQQGLSRIALMGHSMGGKVAMQFAFDNPERVDKLVVVDIAPKAYKPSQRNLLQALREIDLSRYNSFGDVDTALAGKITDRAVRQFVLKNLARGEHGRLRWKLHLEAIYQNYDKLLPELVPQRVFPKPTLFIRGGRSSYIEDNDTELIRQFFTQAEIVTLSKADHWVHIDAPDEFFQKVHNFLSRA
jgi:esterase